MELKKSGGFKLYIWTLTYPVTEVKRGYKDYEEQLQSNMTFSKIDQEMKSVYMF